MKNWTDKILAGMNLIKEGCKENSSWTDCEKCPFETFCSIIEQARREQMIYAFNVDLPSDWFKNENVQDF